MSEQDVAFRAFKNRIVGYDVVPADQLLAHPENMAVHPRSQREQMKEALSSLGWLIPLIVNVRTQHVLDGHLRDDIAMEADDPVPVVYVDLSPEEEIEALATINTIAQQSKIDKGKMQALRDQLTDLTPSLEGLLARAAGAHRKIGEKKQTPDEALSENAAVWDVRPGQVWTLTGKAGVHVVACGDSTDRELVGRILDGAPPALIVTDPPYGVDFVKVKNGIPRPGFEHISDDFEDIRGDTTPELRSLLVGALSAAFDCSRDGVALYLWHPPLSASLEFYGALDDLGIVPHRQIVWSKPGFVFTRSGMYHWSHEVCIFGWRKGSEPQWLGPKNQTTVWEFPRDEKNLPHPTQKPVAIYTTPLQNHTRPGDVLYDPFGGSGTAVEAAERAGRRAVTVELNPEYVALALSRGKALGMSVEVCTI